MKEVVKATVKDWLFLIEGHKKYVTVENLFLNNFTEELNVKTASLEDLVSSTRGYSKQLLNPYRGGELR